MITKKRIQEIRDSPNYSEKAKELIRKAEIDIDKENKESNQKLRDMLGC